MIPIELPPDFLPPGTWEPIAYGRLLNSDIYRVTCKDGTSLVLKTFLNRNFFIRCTMGAFLIHRESRFLKRLAGIEATCRVFAARPLWGIVMEYRPGESLSTFKPGDLPEDYFHSLERSLREIHRRHVVHLDLGHRGNILVTTDHKPFILDFQAALSTRWLPRRLQKFLARVDELAVLKWKSRACPQMLSEADWAAVRKRERTTKLWPFRHWIFLPGSQKAKKSVQKKE